MFGAANGPLSLSGGGERVTVDKGSLMRAETMANRNVVELQQGC